MMSCVSVLPMRGISMHSGSSLLGKDFLSWQYRHRVKGSFSETVPKFGEMLKFLLLGITQVREGLKHKIYSQVKPCMVIVL